LSHRQVKNVLLAAGRNFILTSPEMPLVSASRRWNERRNILSRTQLLQTTNAAVDIDLRASILILKMMSSVE
jgi:hypothetical protein